MSKMPEHTMRTVLWVAKKERSKAVIGDINFYDAVIHGLNTPEGAIIIRDAS